MTKRGRSGGLPGAAGLAAAVARSGAGAGVAAGRGAADHERVGAPGDRGDRERAGSRRGDGDLIGADAVVKTRRAERERRVAQGVVLGVREARLDLRDEVAGIGLGRRVLTLLLLTEERRKSDRGKDGIDPRPGARDGVEGLSSNGERRARGPAFHGSDSEVCERARCYQVPPVLQPPLPAVVQVRV